jgi:hypothetical protein
MKKRLLNLRPPSGTCERRPATFEMLTCPAAALTPGPLGDMSALQNVC